MFVATNLLPSWVGGIIFSGVFAAVQSSIAGICISAGAILAKDFIVDCLMKEVPEKTQSRINYGVIIGVGVIGVLVALKPTDITQYIPGRCGCRSSLPGNLMQGINLLSGWRT